MQDCRTKSWGTFYQNKNTDTLEFQLHRTRLEVLQAKDIGEVLREYRSKAGKPSAGPVQQYGLALCELRSGAIESASMILSRLIEKDPDRILYRSTLANLQLENGQPEKALKTYQSIWQLYPGDLLAGQFYATALLRTGRAGDARELALDMLRTGYAIVG